MNVLIALASSSGQLSGVPRHAINLVRCLLTRPEINEVHLVAAPWQRDFIDDAAPHGDPRLHLHSAPIGNSSISRNLWYYAKLPELARVLRADILHLAYPVPIRRAAMSCPTVVTLHDLYPYDIPENFGFPKVLFNRAVLQQCLREADAIACVSHSTLERLSRLNPRVAENKASVIFNSVERPAIPTSAAQIPQWGAFPFLLCVAQHRSNKNILLALRVFQRLMQSRQLAPETRLLIVGIPGPETHAIQSFIGSSGLDQNVLLLNGISDAQLQWCYRRCRLLFAPSSIEGFGLPVAESLLAGCRVVCSDIAAFHEIGGVHCRYVPLGSGAVEAFAQAILDALNDPQPLPIALPKFAAAAIAGACVELYRSLLPMPGFRTGKRPESFYDAKER